MSKTLRIGYVTEGETDYIVLDALVERFLGATDYVPIRIQPPASEYMNNQGPLGGGWKGVLKWCEQTGEMSEGLARSLPLLNNDCLIIHVDADIATEAELQSHGLAAPCPPAKATCNKIRDHLTALLGNPLPSKVVLCIPAQCTEVWVFAALHSDLVDDFQPIECKSEPEKLLIGKRDRLVRDKDSRARKETQRYRMAIHRISMGWHNAVANCPEAERFDNECRAALAS